MRLLKIFKGRELSIAYPTEVFKQEGSMNSAFSEFSFDKDEKRLYKYR